MTSERSILVPTDVLAAGVGAALVGTRPWVFAVAFAAALINVGSRRVRPGLAEAGVLLQRLAVVVVALTLLGGAPRRMAVAAAAVLVIALVGRQLTERTARRRLARGWGGERTLLVGEADDIGAFARLVAGYPEHGIRPVATATHDGSLPTVLPGGRIGDLVELLRTHAVDHIVVVSASVEEQALDVLGYERPVGVRLSVVPPLASVLTTGVEVSDLRGLPLLSVAPRRAPVGPAWAVKRVLDFTLSALALVVLMPVLLLIALAVRLDSPGPVIFRQKRVGRDGKLFEMWKFRSMVADAEDRLADLLELNEAEGPYFKIAADPRVTRMGRFLRRTCLDELPQLVNVLVGDMSLVGPRPFLPSELATHPEMFTWRMGFLPGMTGPWQVAGRSWLPNEEGLRADLSYLEHWSIRLDLIILIRTLGIAVFGDRHGPVRPEVQVRLDRTRYLGFVEDDDLRPRPEGCDLSIVVVTHNSAGDIGPCLDSLAELPDRVSREVIVVDNQSSDGTADLVEACYPSVRVIRKSRRDGFSLNCNIGATVAAGRHTLLLNPDTRTFPGALDGLSSFLDDNPDVGAVGPKLVYPDGSLQPSARRFPRPVTTIIRRTPLRWVLRKTPGERRHLMESEIGPGPKQVDWLLGAAVALRSDVLHSIGGLDEGYRLYCEDIDLCWRLHERGWAVNVLPAVTIEHTLSELTRKRFFTRRTLWHVRSMARFVLHHGFGRPTIPARVRAARAATTGLAPATAESNLPAAVAPSDDRAQIVA